MAGWWGKLRIHRRPCRVPACWTSLVPWLPGLNHDSKVSPPVERHGGPPATTCQRGVGRLPGGSLPRLSCCREPSRPAKGPPRFRPGSPCRSIPGSRREFRAEGRTWGSLAPHRPILARSSPPWNDRQARTIRRPGPGSRGGLAACVAQAESGNHPWDSWMNSTRPSARPHQRPKAPSWCWPARAVERPASWRIAWPTSSSRDWPPPNRFSS